MRLLMTIALLCLVSSALPAAAVSDVSVRVTPGEPVFREGFTVTVGGNSPVVPQVTDTSVSAGLVRIDLAFGAACGGCLDAPFEIDVPFPRSLVGDDPEPGTYTVEVRDAAGALLGSQDFRILEVTHNTRVESVRVTPFNATDNDSLHISIVYRGDVCDFRTAQLLPPVLAGNDLIVTLDYSNDGPPFGLATKCTPPGPFVTTIGTDLGRLEAGDYRLLVYLIDDRVNPPDVPTLVAFRQLEIEDAPDVLKLQDGRFEASVSWRVPDGRQGPGRPVPGASSDTGLFSFFEPENWELMVKVLDACDANGHFWVIGSASTNVEFDLQVVDTQTGDVYTHRNDQGELARAFGSTTAFPGCTP